MKDQSLSIAGKMRNRITFEQPVQTQDAAGGLTTIWTAAFTVWAEVKYLDGREYWQAQQANSEAEGRITMRYRADVTPDMRIIYGTQTLHILAPFAADNKNKQMRVLFKEARD